MCDIKLMCDRTAQSWIGRWVGAWVGVAALKCYNSRLNALLVTTIVQQQKYILP